MVQISSSCNAKMRRYNQTHFGMSIEFALGSPGSMKLAFDMTGVPQL